jgi:hypothetical protein
MPHSRFLAAVFGLTTGITSLLGAPSSTEARDASAAARGSQRREPSSRASRASRARRASEVTERARRADRARADVPSEASLRVKRVAPRDRDARGRVTGAAKAPAVAAADKAKALPENAVATKSSIETKSGPEGLLGRSGDAPAPAAKAPSEPLPIAKSPAEKFAAEPVAREPADGSSVPAESPLSSARREAAATSGTGASTRPVTVSLEGPVFDSGDVPRAAASLERMKGAFARCASAQTALTKAEATVDLRFLVRAPGRAEGVDVDKARGLSGDVVRCMTSVLARSYIGAPSDDPVGVAVTVRVRKD